jgi:hypothetical protein
MTFDHQKKNLYGAAMKKWSSFAVKSPTEIIHEASHPIGGDRTLPVLHLATRHSSQHPLTISNSPSSQPRHKHPRHLPPRRPPAPVRRLRKPLLQPRRLRQRLLRFRLRSPGVQYPELPLFPANRHPRHGLRPDRNLPLLRRPLR